MLEKNVGNVVGGKLNMLYQKALTGANCSLLYFQTLITSLKFLFFLLYIIVYVDLMSISFGDSAESKVYANGTTVACKDNVLRFRSTL